MQSTDFVDKAFRLTLLSVGTVIRKTDLQSVHEGGTIMRSMILIAPTDVPPFVIRGTVCGGFLMTEEGDDTNEKR